MDAVITVAERGLTVEGLEAACGVHDLCEINRYMEHPKALKTAGFSKDLLIRAAELLEVEDSTCGKREEVLSLYS